MLSDPCEPMYNDFARCTTEFLHRQRLGFLYAGSMEPVRAKLKAMREAARPKLSVREMAEQLGFGRDNHNRYAYYENVFAKDVLPIDLTRKIADILETRGIDREDVMRLATGIEPDFEEEGSAPGRIDPELLERLNIVEIPAVDMQLGMGALALFTEYSHVGFKYFDREWVEVATKADPANLRFYQGIGDSMIPTIHPTDAVLVNVAENMMIHPDQIWAFSYAGSPMIKRLRPLPSGDEFRRFLVISDNPVVENFVATDDEITIVGRVVWIGRKV